MIDEIRKLFAQSWSAFLAETGRREPEDQVAELLSGMRREMVQARANLPLHEEGVRRAEAELERERAALADAERRGAMAQRIGDAETARIAQEFTERHRRRVAVLEDKLRAARAERDLANDEASEMMRRYKEADTNRFLLVSELRRRGVQGRLDPGLAGSADAARRAEERIMDEAAYADALGDLGDLGADGATPPPPGPDVDDRLAELKRRLGM